MLPVNQRFVQFKNLCNGQVVQIPQLTKDRPYPVLGARSVSAPYGPTVIFTLRTEGDIEYIDIEYTSPGDMPMTSMKMTLVLLTRGW